MNIVIQLTKLLEKLERSAFYPRTGHGRHAAALAPLKCLNDLSGFRGYMGVISGLACGFWLFMIKVGPVEREHLASGYILAIHSMIEQKFCSDDSFHITNRLNIR